VSRYMFAASCLLYIICHSSVSETRSHLQGTRDSQRSPNKVVASARALRSVSRQSKGACCSLSYAALSAPHSTSNRTASQRRRR